jgi:hypothetical protein
VLALTGGELGTEVGSVASLEGEAQSDNTAAKEARVGTSQAIRRIALR